MLSDSASVEFMMKTARATVAGTKRFIISFIFLTHYVDFVSNPGDGPRSHRPIIPGILILVAGRERGEQAQEPRTMHRCQLMRTINGVDGLRKSTSITIVVQVTRSARQAFWATIPVYAYRHLAPLPAWTSLTVSQISARI